MAKEKKEQGFIEAMIKEGLPIKDCVLFETVRATGMGPVNEIHDPEEYPKEKFTKEKLGKMWLTPIGLIAEMNAKYDNSNETKEIVIIGLANIRFTRPS